MLHIQTVKGETLDLLTRLMQDSTLADFNLVGGTALALYLGHRMSIDLDLFVPRPFDAEELKMHLTTNYGFKNRFVEKHTLMGYIDDVKVDLITHAYPYVDERHITGEGIRLISMRDIAAMKLSAIVGNGTRLKDFIDVAFLSTRMSLSDMLRDYERKYANTTALSALRSLTYFDDVNHKEPVQIIDRAYKWENIERRLRQNFSDGSFGRHPAIGEKGIPPVRFIGRLNFTLPKSLSPICCSFPAPFRNSESLPAVI